MAIVMKKKAMPFEMSRRDKEPRGMKEGGKREEAMDSRQMKTKARKMPMRGK
jgi:hypothetical protein